MMPLIGLGSVQSHDNHETVVQRFETFDIEVTNAVGIDQKMTTAIVIDHEMSWRSFCE